MVVNLQVLYSVVRTGIDKIVATQGTVNLTACLVGGDSCQTGDVESLGDTIPHPRVISSFPLSNMMMKVVL